jgi:hypothetical protein
MATLRDDFLINAFYCACANWKANELATPFPPPWRIGDLKDTRGIVNALDNDVESSEKLKWLIEWITKPTKLRLELVSSLQESLKASETPFQLLDDTMTKLDAPDYVFKVHHASDFDEKHVRLASKHGSFLAFHGTSFENAHSILHHGLLNHTTQRAVFGHGIYVASRLDVARAFCKPGSSRLRNNVRDKLDVVFACQVINHPESVFQEKRKHVDHNVLDDAIPPGYFVVQDNDMIKIRYILVYRHAATLNGGLDDYLKFALLFLAALYFFNLLR